MSLLSPAGDASLTRDELQEIRDLWWIFLLTGIAMVVFGSVAISWACLTTITLAATWFFGLCLLVGGIGEIIHGVSALRWGGSIVHLLLGVLYAIVGFTMIDAPLESAILLTRLISIFLMVSGAFRIVAALVQRFPGWFAIVLSGVISIVLGVMIYKQWPASGLWFIGLYLGIEMIMSGASRIALAFFLKSLPESAK